MAVAGTGEFAAVGAIKLLVATRKVACGSIGFTVKGQVFDAFLDCGESSGTRRRSAPVG